MSSFSIPVSCFSVSQDDGIGRKENILACNSVNWPVCPFPIYSSFIYMFWGKNKKKRAVWRQFVQWEIWNTWGWSMITGADGFMGTCNTCCILGMLNYKQHTTNASELKSDPTCSIYSRGCIINCFCYRVLNRLERELYNLLMPTVRNNLNHFCRL